MPIRILLYIMLSLQPVMAQVPAYPVDLPMYDFIRYDDNLFKLIDDNKGYRDLFAKFDTLIRTGNNQIKIVHLGGSHVQADVYTHRVRQELQSLYPGILGSRGFFFPYPLAQTNSPANLWVTYSGTWKSCKSTQPEPAFPLGLSGITSVLTSTSGSIKIVTRFDSLNCYDFNRIKIFCNAGETGIFPEIKAEHLPVRADRNITTGYIQYNLTDFTDTLCMYVVQPDSVLKPFQLYGISLENNDPGVVYSSVGINGARLESYLRCGLFVQQLKSLEPDWVIVSIGTNEGNTRRFDAGDYRAEYLKLLDSIRLAAPKAALLLTVPNDCYLFKRYINYNTAAMREIIFDIARTYRCGVWDFYMVMGGLNSAKAWYNHGLMNKDHIHFNKPGYLLKGDLFFRAFLQSWDDHLPQKASKQQLSSPDLHSLYPHNKHQESRIEYPRHD